MIRSSDKIENLEATDPSVECSGRVRSSKLVEALSQPAGVSRLSKAPETRAQLLEQRGITTLPVPAATSEGMWAAQIFSQGDGSPGVRVTYTFSTGVPEASPSKVPDAEKWICKNHNSILRSTYSFDAAGRRVNEAPADQPDSIVGGSLSDAIDPFAILSAFEMNGSGVGTQLHIYQQLNAMERAAVNHVPPKQSISAALESLKAVREKFAKPVDADQAAMEMGIRAEETRQYFAGKTIPREVFEKSFCKLRRDILSVHAQQAPSAAATLKTSSAAIATH